MSNIEVPWTLDIGCSLFDICSEQAQPPEEPRMQRGQAETPLLIGWKEYVSFPEWGNRRVKAKIDTGARTSALDVVSYDLRDVPGQGLVAELRLALHRKRRDGLVIVQAPVLRMIAVRNSNGVREQRPLIEASIRLGPVSKRIRLTVTNRSGMRFRMIVGRKALEGSFVVDVGRKYVLGSLKPSSPATGERGCV
jgi:hypothetical protein